MEIQRKVQILKLTYIIGGLYDLILGSTLVFGLTWFGKTLSTILGPLPQPLLFGQVAGLFLMTVGYYLVYSSREPLNYVFIAVGSVFVRLSYGLLTIYTVLILQQPIDALYILLAFTDTISGVLILVALLWNKALNLKKLY